MRVETEKLTKPRLVSVYLPVCVYVEVDEEGKVLSLANPTIDYEGAPWMEVGSENDVYDEDNDEWLDHEETEDLVIAVIGAFATNYLSESTER